MQHIGLQRESETGDVEDLFDLDGIDTRIVERASDSSPFLASIDPHGNTVFNQLQLPHVISELEVMAAQTPEADLRENVARVIAFLRGSISVHTYVRFVGD